ncbi:hypothetical protein KAR91_55690 [Candidatus Pacearchaeota archaeon]|nr:hypothetical protein [Candidatus Pacearchaeota archaeon]
MINDITITITQSELEDEHSKERSDSKSVLAGEKEHAWLKAYAATHGVSVKALINCFASKLQETQ